MTKEAAMQSSSSAVTSSPTSSSSSAMSAAIVAAAPSSSSSSSSSCSAASSAKSKLLLFDVSFAGGRSVFRSGEKVSGWVTVETRGPVYAAAYQVECLGYSELPEHPAPAGQGIVPSVVAAVAKQRQSAAALTSRTTANQKRHLALKENLLPFTRLVEKRSFEFQLPRWLPHSVECEELGCVRYCCRAVVAFADSPAATVDSVEATRYFTVIEDVDLNSPTVSQLCSFEEVTCNSSDRLITKLLKDEVKTSLTLKKDAYVPGENVHCVLSVHSSSSLPVQRIALRLVQRSTAVGTGGRQLGTRSRTVVQEMVISDSQESGKYWSAKHKLHIPGVVATSLANAHFQHPIVVEYAMQMCVTLGFAHVPIKDLTVGCPIVIGTVPRLDSPGQLAALDASFVEASHCAIPPSGCERQRRNSRGSLFASFHAKKSSSIGYRSPQLQYTLYCIYYPTISIYRQKPQSGRLKSILKVKHSSIDNLEAAEKEEPATAGSVRPVAMKRSTSMGWYETPL